jgi:hypothetical protein
MNFMAASNPTRRSAPLRKRAIYLTSYRAPAFQPMKITASEFDMRHTARRPLCTELHKIKPECAFANILKGRGRAAAPVPHALGRTLMTDHHAEVKNVSAASLDERHAPSNRTPA